MEEIMNRSESSIEISRNSKGQVQLDIKAYNSDLNKAKEEAVKVYDELNSKYPFV